MTTSIIDLPKEAGQSDNFGIEPFENGLKAFIENSSTPITIALQGEWGSGKTSLMNSLKQNLCMNDTSKFYSVWLNTWEFALMKDASTTLIDIIVKLIEEISKIAGVENEKRNQLLKNVKRIGFSALKVISSLNSVATATVDEIEKNFNQEQNITISQIRDELEFIIKNCLQKNSNKQGFIFFIDDLDRIDPPVAVQLLELLKNIFTLKNCIFILAIDYDVVIKGLEPKFGKLSETNEREFRSFFDKIIQVPFSMPVTNYRVDLFLKESLKTTNYLNEKQVNDVKLIEKFSEISNLSVGSNPRALKRLLNSLSLISCINSAKSQTEENKLDDDIELLVNFALVSIQIAYPPVYILLSKFPNFVEWNENVSLQYNLTSLDDLSIKKLQLSEEFDEEWEQVLFRLCEKDHYLKKKALNVSRLLNLLKKYITEKGENIEDVIDSIISLSSVTHLEAFDKPTLEYHKGNFLKHLRHLLIPKLKEKIPNVAQYITSQGKRVESNAYIKFSEKDWNLWLKMHSLSAHGKLRLVLSNEKYMCRATHDTIQESMNDLGFLSELKAIESSYNIHTLKFKDVKQNSLLENISKRENCFIVGIYSFVEFSSVEEFYKPQNIELISDVITSMFEHIESLSNLSVKCWDKIKKGSEI